MYDYLAKVILLGPSGCGKSVPPSRASSERYCQYRQLIQCPDLASSTVSSRMNVRPSPIPR